MNHNGPNAVPYFPPPPGQFGQPPPPPQQSSFAGGFPGPHSHAQYQQHQHQPPPIHAGISPAQPYNQPQGPPPPYSAKPPQPASFHCTAVAGPYPSAPPIAGFHHPTWPQAAAPTGHPPPAPYHPSPQIPHASPSPSFAPSPVSTVASPNPQFRPSAFAPQSPPPPQSFALFRPPLPTPPPGATASPAQSISSLHTASAAATTLPSPPLPPRNNPGVFQPYRPAPAAPQVDAFELAPDAKAFAAPAPEGAAPVKSAYGGWPTLLTSARLTEILQPATAVVDTRTPAAAEPGHAPPKHVSSASPPTGFAELSGEPPPSAGAGEGDGGRGGHQEVQMAELARQVAELMETTTFLTQPLVQPPTECPAVLQPQTNDTKESMAAVQVAPRAESRGEEAEVTGGEAEILPPPVPPKKPLEGSGEDGEKSEEDLPSQSAVSNDAVTLQQVAPSSPPALAQPDPISSDYPREAEPSSFPQSPAVSPIPVPASTLQPAPLCPTRPVAPQPVPPPPTPTAEQHPTGEATTRRPPTTSDESESDYESRARPLPQIRDVGPPNPTLFECPEARALHFATTWYRLPSVPDFLACSRCYEMYIAPHPALAAAFERVDTLGPGRRCRLNVPRLTRALLPRARSPGEGLEAVEAFMRRRLGVPDCAGSAGLAADAAREAGARWFRPADGVPEGFLACGACHEDVVLTSPFGERFVPHDVEQPAEQLWTCDLCVPFIRRAFLHFSRPLPSEGDGAVHVRWGGFVEATRRRLVLPPCEGKPVQATSTGWMRLGGGGEGGNLVICETCFLDKVGLTAIEHGFERAEPQQRRPQHPSTDSPQSAGGSEVLGFFQRLNRRAAAAAAAAAMAAAPVPTWTCRAQTLPVAMALDAAVSRHDAAVFGAAAATIASSPACTEVGVGAGFRGGAWYTLLRAGSDAPPDFAVCGACHAGWLETWGLGRFFQPLLHDSATGSGPGICSFHPTHPRFAPLALALGEAVDTGVWAVFASAVARWSGVPRCPRDLLVAGRKWWGHDDCTICPECFFSACEDADGAAALAPILPLRDAVVPESRMCCMYSPRMRAQWRLAAASASREDPEAALAGLVGFSRTRTAVYLETVPRMKMLMQLQNMQMLTALHKGMLSATYQGSGSFREAAGATDGYLYGNNSLGWHNTHEAATGAALSQEMQTGFNAVNAQGMDIISLAARWDAWE